MKHLALIVAWIALAIPLHTHATDALTVTLHRTAQPSTRGSIEILVVFTNHTDEPDYIYRPESPFGRDDQLPSSDFLKVFDSSGNPIRYVGARDHWGPIRDSHFVEIAPHESVSRVVNIADAYDFGNGGVFSIRYAAIKRNVSMARTSSNQARRLEQTNISSGELVIDVDGPGSASFRSTARPGGTGQVNCCSQCRQSGVLRDGYHSVRRTAKRSQGRQPYVCVAGKLPGKREPLTTPRSHIG